MINTIQVTEVRFPGLTIHPAALHKVRGYFGQVFQKYDLIHNHEPKTGTVIFRYPAIQFKSLDQLSIYGYSAAASQILQEIFLKSHSIRIDDTLLEIHESQLELREDVLGEDGAFYDYEFLAPWVALNQTNFTRYNSLQNPSQQNDMLNSILISNIIAFCKFAGYTVTEKLLPQNQLIPVRVILKDKIHMAFKGTFKVNFRLPDSLGLGKSSSRGYGAIRKIKG